MIYRAHPKQIAFHKSEARIRGAFAGKRGGKTEAGAVESILRLSNKPSTYDDSVDPWLLVIIAPTTDMLRRLSMAKFLAYAKPFINIDNDYNKSVMEGSWPNGAKFIGVSADKPSRLEGLKASCGIWIDEVLQCEEQVFLEAQARVADAKGRLWVTGSLGVQYVNPKSHWAYRQFKEKPKDGTEVFEWATADNPYFPRDELARLKETLDPQSYRAMFEINWDTQPQNVIYSDFNESNITKNTYKPEFPVHVSIDWGFGHPTAVLFFQYDERRDVVYIIDEIYKQKTVLDDIYQEIMAKRYRVTNWYCDAAGLQTREQTAMSNVDWFKTKYNVHFKWRRTNVIPGISLVRSYVLSGNGQRRLYVDEKCSHTIDEFKNYRFKEKDGQTLDEPLKEHDHAMDAVRYWFVNHIAPMKKGDSIKTMNAWDVLKW